MSKVPAVMVVRSKPHGHNREKQFLDGVLSIGWPTPESLKDADRATVEQILNKVHPDYASTVNVSQVYNFIRIPVGSIVLSPSYETRDVHLFRTISDYEYKPEWATDEIGNPHTIRAEYIKTVSREVFPDLVNRALLAAKKTVTDFTKYADLILPVIDGDSGFQQPAELTPPDPDTRDKATKTLLDLLDSKDDQVRLQAALALLGKGK